MNLDLLSRAARGTIPLTCPGAFMTAQSDKYRFGPYELRIRTRELYKYGTRLKLRPQTFLVLQVLVEHAGDVVTREELRELLWPAETFVDFERGLNTLVKELRRILSDSASEPRYVETLPKLGYRIVAPVEAEAACHVAPRSDVRAVGVSTVEETAPVSSRPRRPLSPLWRRVWLSCALATMLIAILAGFIVITRYPG